MFNFKKKKVYPRYSYYDSVLNEDGEQVSTKEALGGKTDKIFVRMDSEFLEDYFKDVAKGDCSYVTYLDDIALDYLKGKKIPVSAVSTLLKLYDSASKRAYNEDIGSRVGNLIGVPVVYNRAYKCGSVIFNMSIDYMKYGDHMEYGVLYPDYTGKNEDPYNGWGLNEWKHYLKKAALHDPKTGMPIPLEKREKLVESFIPTYFFRRYVLKDTDFGFHNMCIVHDKRNDSYKFGPNYDMERAFYSNTTFDEYLSRLSKDMHSAMVTHPKLMKNFMTRLSKISSSQLITPWLFGNIEDKKYRNKAIKSIYQSINTMCHEYTRIREKIGESEDSSSYIKK
ncbi:MAG: hypothetical protein J6V40_00355 [Clostridia bacterium]|nr:hypothetical protein [Clostridia bacterium]